MTPRATSGPEKRKTKNEKRRKKNAMDLNSLFSGAKLPSQALTFVGPGKHLCALSMLEHVHKEGKPPMFRADFVVLESNGEHQPDDVLSTFFRPYASEYPGAGQNEMGRLLDLLNKLFNKELDAATGETTLKSLLSIEQPGRGIRIQIDGYLVTNADGTPKLTKKGGKIVNTGFTGVSQTPEQVAACRGAINTMTRYAPKAAPAPAPAPAAPAAAAVETSGLLPGLPGLG